MTITICKECGNEFSDDKKTGRPRIFCYECSYSRYKAGVKKYAKNWYLKRQELLRKYKEMNERLLNEEHKIQ